MNSNNLRNIIANEIFPAEFEQYKKETNTEFKDLEELLLFCGLTTVCRATVNNWMRKLGMDHKEQQKNYYTDKHESEENITYRLEFIEWYLEKELDAYRWVQMSVDDAQEICCQLEMNKEIQSWHGFD